MHCLFSYYLELNIADLSSMENYKMVPHLWFTFLPTSTYQLSQNMIAGIHPNSTRLLCTFGTSVPRCIVCTSAPCSHQKSSSPCVCSVLSDPQFVYFLIWGSFCTFWTEDHFVLSRACLPGIRKSQTVILRFFILLKLHILGLTLEMYSKECIYKIFLIKISPH